MYKEESDLTMIYGTRAVMEALQAGKEFEKVFIQNGLNIQLVIQTRTGKLD